MKQTIGWISAYGAAWIAFCFFVGSEHVIIAFVLLFILAIPVTFAVFILVMWIYVLLFPSTNRQQVEEPQPISQTITESPPITIDNMTGTQFEQCLADLFMGQGYTVHSTGGSGDQGVDLIVERGISRIAVQAKRWMSAVSNTAVLKEAVRYEAVKWIDENKPQHWARSMFAD